MSDTAERTSIADRVRAFVRDGGLELPPLPELALRLQTVLADEGSDAKKVAALVQSDPAVAASLMRIANSAAFGGLSAITDLNRAVARLGFKQVGSIVTAILLKGTLTEQPKDRSDVLKSIWDHSVSTAFCARRLASRAVVDSEQAFLAGLLHDTGRLVVLKAVDRLEEEDLGIEFTPPVVQELMDSLHCEVGHATLQTWKLPDQVSEVALRHEDELNDADPPLVHCIKAANLVTKKLGFHIEPDVDLDLGEEIAASNLKMTEIAVTALMIDLEDELVEVRTLF